MTVYLPRTAWKARPSRGPKPLPAGRLLGITLHYPGMGDRQLITRDQVAAALRGWQDFHMNDREWSDIAYQVAVDQAGRAWELRGLQTRSGANGDATTNLQYGAILLVIGDTENPTTELISTTRSVVADFRRHYPRATLIKPHSAVRPDGTKCPGDRVRKLIGLGAFNPTTPTTSEKTVTPAQMNELAARMSLNALWLHYRVLDDLRDVAVTVKSPEAALLAGKVNAAKKAYEEKAAELS